MAALDLRAADEDEGWLGEPDNGYDESAYAEWDAADEDRTVVAW